MLPKSPVPGAMAAVDVPNTVETGVFAVDPNTLCVLAASVVVCNRLVSVGNELFAPSSVLVCPTPGGSISPFFTSLFFSSCKGSDSFSFFNAGAVGCVMDAPACCAPNVSGPPVAAPKVKVEGLLLELEPKLITDLVESEVTVETSALGMA